MVYQVPYMAYPEEPAIVNMVDYDPFVGYLHSHDLRWSYGAMRNTKADSANAPSLAGDIERIYTFCSSQPCRTMHDFVGLGFNEAEGAGGAKAFDGVLNWKGGGSGIFMNYRFGQPVRTHRQHIARWTPVVRAIGLKLD